MSSLAGKRMRARGGEELHYVIIDVLDMNRLGCYICVVRGVSTLLMIMPVPGGRYNTE